MKLFSGSAHPQFADALAKHLNIALSQAHIHSFPDGEIYVEVQEDLSGEDVFILQSMAFPINDHLMELLILIDAAKRSFPRQIIPVIPYFGYSRQDTYTGAGRPMSAKLVADLLIAAGAQRIIVLDVHTDHIGGFFNAPVHLLSAQAHFKAYYERVYKKTGRLTRPLVVSPDVGGVKRAFAFSQRIGLDFCLINKDRSSWKNLNIPDVVQERDCVIIDDIVDSGQTLINTATALKHKGAGHVISFVTHGVLSEDTVEHLQNSCCDHIVLTNSLPLQEKIEGFNKICNISVISVFSDLIKRISTYTHSRSFS